MLKNFVKFFIRIIFKKPINYFLKKKNFLVIFRHGSAIGDHMYLSSVIREIYKLDKKIILFSNYYQIFLNNPKIYKLFKFGKKSFVWFFLRSLTCETILEFQSKYAIKENHEIKKKYFLYFHKKKIHLAQAASEHFNLGLNYKSLKNEFFLSEGEKRNFKNELNLPKKFALIQSVSKSSFTKNKEWTLKGMQHIVNHFNKISWIQIGLSSEPKLQNCEKYLDLDLRKLAFLISKCEFLVSYEGLFNHIASCFEKKNFLIHTGFLHEEAFYYKNNILIEKNKDLKCYPCYSMDCETHREECLKNITHDYVVKVIERNIN